MKKSNANTSARSPVARSKTSKSTEIRQASNERQEWFEEALAVEGCLENFLGFWSADLKRQGRNELQLHRHLEGSDDFICVSISLKRMPINKALAATTTAPKR